MLWKHTQCSTNQEKKVPEYPPRSVQFDLAKRLRKSLCQNYEGCHSIPREGIAYETAETERVTCQTGL